VVTGTGKSNLRMSKIGGRRITQHKRFVPYGTHPNSAFGGTSFMLETLAVMLKRKQNYKIDNMTLKNEQLDKTQILNQLSSIDDWLSRIFYTTLFQFFSKFNSGSKWWVLPLQVRYLLANGQLGFSDMPMLFFLDVFLKRTSPRFIME